MRSEPIGFTCDMGLQTVLQLKGYYQNTAHSINKTDPNGQVSKYLKHVNAMKNRVETSSVPLFFIGQWTFDPFQMDQPKNSP